MRQRGRKSSSFVALRVDGSPPPLQPPAYLNDEERALFAELIAACDTRAFVPSRHAAARQLCAGHASRPFNCA